MSSSAPQPGLAQPSGQVSKPSGQSLQAEFDTGIWYHLCLWPALKVAVENHWGGPTSADKRDWFAGAVSDLFTERPDTDQLDLESVLLQVMQDEFDVNVEDESEVAVASGIMKLRSQVQEGDVRGVQEVRKRWEKRKGRTEKVNVVEHKTGENGDDFDEDDEDDEDEDDEEDVEMGDDPPQLIPVKEKQQPEIDGDGFQKVVSKKKR